MSNYTLEFKYGTVNSAKTASLLMLAHNFKDKEKILIKPDIDKRVGDGKYIFSRTGLKQKADLIVKNDDNIVDLLHARNIKCIFVDEVNFLTEKHINQLRSITKICNVICYGLKTDYTTKLFPASKRLLEIADKIEEITTTCSNCFKNKATVNMKIGQNGKIIKKGDPIIDLGFEDKYKAVCWKCWQNA